MIRQASDKDLVLEINPNPADPNSSAIYNTMHDAFQFVSNSVDLQGNKLILNLSNGTHAGFRTYGKLVGGSIVEIRGTTVVGQRSRIGTGVGNCILNDRAGLEIVVSDLTLAGGLYAFYGGRIRTEGGIIFETTANDHFHATYEGQIYVEDDYAVTGNASTQIHTYTRGSIVMQKTALTVDPIDPAVQPPLSDDARFKINVALSPNLTFHNFIGVADASLVARNITVSNSFTGTSILVHKLGFADLAQYHVVGSENPKIVSGGVVT